VGNYCSVAPQIVVLRRDHPLHRLSQHPFFYNSSLRIVEHDTIQGNEDNPLVIGHDVWIGERVSILSGCRTIGNGAVVAAGSVVTRDIPPYTIVAGVPAKPLKVRFDKETITQLEMSKWWKLTLEELLEYRNWLSAQMNLEVAQSLRQEITRRHRR
jgi:acetyltransferase-like isoleucine patch superfamily enzyme